MELNDLNDDQLLLLIIQIDTELFQSGVEIKGRPIALEQRMMEMFGHVYILGSRHNSDLERVRALASKIYRPQDIAMGGHIGVFMYHDIFARISVPHVYGNAKINIFDHVDLTPMQMQILQHSPEQCVAFLDQFLDVMDIYYGSNDLKSSYSQIELFTRFLGLAQIHLHAAAAIVTGGYDFRGAVQNALLATELGLKAIAAAEGQDAKSIKIQFNHNLNALIENAAAKFPQLDSDRVRRAIASQPPYVANRYASQQPKRLEVGHTIMRAQYIVSEVVRLFSHRDIRQSLDEPPIRYYPP